jgi:polysaccharide export outer membrane protein
MNRLIIIAFFLFGIVFCGCKTVSIKTLKSNHEWFQYSEDSTGKPKYIDSSQVKYKDLIIKPLDHLKIQIFTNAISEQSQTSIFNLPGNAGGASGAYLVDKEGFIDYPRIGKIKVEGLTSKSLKDTLAGLLEQYVKDVRIVANIVDIPVYAFGEIGRKGKIEFKEEKINLLDFFAEIGFNDYGKKSNILVVREDSGKHTYYNIDVRYPQALYESPVFQLQQNDVVYVYADDRRYRQMKSNDYSVATRPGLLTLSIITTVINFVFFMVALAK